MKLLHQGGYSTKREDQAYFNPKGKELSTKRTPYENRSVESVTTK